jgi:NAD-dependent DNA ligase
MNLLYGILWGIGCDKVITQKEHAALFDWMEENKAYQKDVNFHESFQMLTDVLEDGNLSAKEYGKLLRLVGMHITSARYSNTTQAMQILMGIIKGILSDTQINAKEVSALYMWMQAHDNLKGNYPFDKIFDALTQVLADGILDPEEEKILLAIFEQFLNPRQTCACGNSLSGEPSAVGINLSGKTCCLTGDFSYGTKAEVEKHISNSGGICIPTITREVDYLIVGGQGSEAWIYGNYGTKVKKALQMQENGHRVQIVGEDVIYEG